MGIPKLARSQLFSELKLIRMQTICTKHLDSHSCFKQFSLALLRMRNKLIAEPHPSSRLLKYQQKFPVKAEMIMLVPHLSVWPTFREQGSLKPWQPRFCSCLHSFEFSRMLCSWSHTECGLFRLVSFTQQNTSKGSLCLFLA